MWPRCPARPIFPVSRWPRDKIAPPTPEADPRRLRTWADRNEVYLIADEIAAGMGRCGAQLASHLAGVDAALPDFAVISKGLTGGMLPLTAVLTTDEVYGRFLADYQELKAFLHSNTYTGNALAIAVGNAVFDAFAEDDVLSHVARTGPALRRCLETVAERTGCLHDIRGVGMIAAADLHARDGSALDPKARTGYQVYQAAVERGALLRPLGDTLYLFPPLIIDESTIDRLADIASASIEAVLG